MPYLIAFVTTVVLVEYLRRRANSLDLLEHPGEHREHLTATPLVGGIAMFGGIVAGWMWILPEHWTALILGTAVVVATGVWDDRHQLSFLFRFAGQVVAAGIMVYIGGNYLHDLGYLTTDEYLLYLGRWSTPLTIFAAVGVMNALNMSDGMDGLAASLGLVTFLSLLLLGIGAGRADMGSELMVIIATIIGFLAYNASWPGRKSALVFMGDGGSLLLGFLLGWYLIGLSQGEERLMSPVTALWIFALPLFDAVGVMLRRVIRGRSPFKSDREHYHHYLLALGLTVNQTLLVVLGTSLLLALMGLSGWYLQIPERWLFYGFLGLFAIFVIAMECFGRRRTLRDGVPREAT